MENSDFIGRIVVSPPLDKGELKQLQRVGDAAPGWAAERGGGVLVFGGAPYAEAATGLRYLVGYFRRRGLSRFEGMVVGCVRDTGELTSVQARGGRVTEKGLWPQETTSRVRRSATPPAPTAQVIDLASRRAARG